MTDLNVDQMTVITTLTGTELSYKGVSPFNATPNNSAITTANEKLFYKGVSLYTSGGGNPNGTVAGVIGDTLYATANGITWVCTTTGNSTGAVWTASASLITQLGTNTYTGTAYTLQVTDANKFLQFTNAGAVTVTVPPNVLPLNCEILITLANGSSPSLTLSGGGVDINSLGSNLTLKGPFAVATLKQLSLNVFAWYGQIGP